ncbi:hypothetical protein SteCoe_18808 [Stentor coeruleus]|uniref:DUF676 domain-containing protein n=1 Tax=Stentor coeruleus TaxID=5963 RepID=A0A1R2BW25_9CILI|nr:hypothetical protein SteCoe_18808 [Stentor coeruleus]
MSLRAIVEIVVHLESFRNIDLFQQGLYYLQFEIFHTMSGKKFSASPYNIYSSDNPPKNSVRIPGQVIDIFYNSQAFYIKYCDEDVDLNEIAVFRTEVEVNNESEIPYLTIQCNLMYCDLGGRITGKMLKSIMDNPPGFTKEASLEIQVLNYIEGVNQFVPIIFDDSHFCLMNSTIHVLLIDFRFRPTPMVSSIEENTQGPNKPAQELNIPMTLAEIFFPPGVDATSELIDQIHEKYIRLLTIVHNKNMRLIREWEEYLKIGQVNQTVKSVIPLESLSLDSTRDSIKSRSEPFSSTLEGLDLSKIAEKILLKIQEMAGNMHYLLYNFIQVLQKATKHIAISLMYDYNTRLKDRWGESIFRKVCQVDNYNQLGEQNLASIHKSASRSLRSSEYYQNMEEIPISVVGYFPKPEFHPILFMDVYSIAKNIDNDYDPSWVKFTYNRTKATHLIVFVHGFQGNSFDVRLIRNQVALCRPDTILMCSHMNEGETEGNILQMGERLSEEVVQYINEWCPKNSLEKISFIGHSLGGLIIRASLPYLTAYQNKFQFFITFSSPHLGYMYNTSKIVDAGMWIIKKWKKSECLKQLSMTDNTDSKASFLYSLSLAQGIEWFKYIAFVGAHQDSYAPFESARIEVGPKASNDAKGRLYIEMASNILSRITANKLYRIDVNLKLKKKNLDSMIGRAAHIQMLDNNILVQMVLHCCAHFFQY